MDGQQQDTDADRPLTQQQLQQELLVFAQGVREALDQIASVQQRLLRQELADFSEGQLREITALKTSLLQEIRHNAARVEVKSSQAPIRTTARQGHRSGYVPLQQQSQPSGPSRSPPDPAALVASPRVFFLPGTETKSWEDYFTEMVHGQNFEIFVASMVGLNSLWIGVQTFYAAENWTFSTPWSFVMVDLMFCVIFLGELLSRMRFGGLRRFFLSVPACYWNWFDTIVVGSQVVDTIGNIFVDDYNGGAKMLAALRYVRMVRVLRIARLTVALSELRKLIDSVSSAMAPLTWTVILLAILIYAFAVVLTNLVTEHKIQKGRESMEEHEELLLEFFGSFYSTMLTLFMIVADGIHWYEVSRPLRDDISPWMELAMVAFVVFMLLAIMNIITARFVESVMKTAEENERREIRSELWSMFSEHFASEGRIDKDNMMIGRDAFKAFADHPKMLEFISMVGIPPEESDRLFDLLDQDGDGDMTATEFVTGCEKLVGPARAEMCTRIEHAMHQQRGEIAKLLQLVRAICRIEGLDDDRIGASDHQNGDNKSASD
eukprot:TRINITY_DN76165_c0_g1_i1.p1 TRINITY_DN76165_c0_g1~~TRINITY_DN76165_c0_g1_i1.p1  ORF type:complete len:549 (+),score=101.58 TRINITY_DN76165_c0_g1_i1:98-1744(+)